MKSLKFVKIHGIGNDYIYIDGINSTINKLSDLSIKISNRHFGVGSDGLIALLPSQKADFRMRMFNADGSEAEMCGNGIRGLAKMIHDHGFSKKKQLTIETLAGIMELELTLKDNKVSMVTVDMGEPILEREKIPMIGEPGHVIEETIELEDSVKFELTAVSVGNPHAIIFVEDVDNFPIEKYGSLIEKHPLFPSRINVEFVKILSSNEAKQRTWERGSGETMACGTGATAVTVAGALTGRLDSQSTIHLLGGDLMIRWDKQTNHLFMTGPATEVFKGEWFY
ncbi:MAG: diaminopimelate epimerase [Spirochaetes bacterium]|nr:diaminopimelate epimerase [Spirochaetota bacterium]MBN2771021.1 diaminopimelate epimerase [Spirochaetota bacterium]